MANPIVLIGGPGHGQKFEAPDWPKYFEFEVNPEWRECYVRTVFTRWEDAGIDAAWYVYTLGQIPPDEAIFALIDQHQVAPICKATELAQNGLGMSVVPWPPRP